MAKFFHKLKKQKSRNSAESEVAMELGILQSESFVVSAAESSNHQQ